jgi:hypothetical protein
MFLLAVFAVGILSGATAAVAGFGIGSLLTPLLVLQLGTATAVAGVAIPHAVATALRCWRLRYAVDPTVVRSFGLLSAGGGLIGALLYTRFSDVALTFTLGLLLLATAAATLADLPSRLHAGRPLVAALGLLSGLFGGLAGNQGGLRAAAMLTFGLPPVSYVATSTATAMMVDVVRTPIYVWRAGGDLVPVTAPLLAATAGVVVGTLIGERILLGMSRQRFRRVIAVAIGLLGAWLLVEAGRSS